MWVWSLGRDNPLEEGMTTPSSILAWQIPWTEKPDGLQPIRSQSLTRLKWLRGSSIQMSIFLTILTHPEGPCTRSGHPQAFARDRSAGAPFMCPVSSLLGLRDSFLFNPPICPPLIYTLKNDLVQIPAWVQAPMIAKAWGPSPIGS